MTTPTAKTTKVPHHRFENGKPLCGVKGKALVAFTAASPVGSECGRCSRVYIKRVGKLTAAPKAETKPAAAPKLTLVQAVEVDAANERAKAKKQPKAPTHVEGSVHTFLLNPTFTFTPTGKIATITGTCPECKTNERTIAHADAFQVRRCHACQRKAISRRVNEYRKAKRRAARATAKA